MTIERPVRRTSPIRRIFAVIIAVVITPLALWALFVGGADVYRAATQHSGVNGIGLLFAFAGIALLLIVVQTCRVSSLGLGIVSLVLTVSGVVVLVWPAGETGTVRFFRGLSPELASGAEQWMSAGLVVALGLVLWGAAVAARIARRATEVSSASALRGVLSIVFAAIGGVLGLGLLWGGGALVDGATQTAVDTGAIGVVSAVIGALVLAGVALTAVISSAGIFVIGALIFVVGALAFVFEGIGRAMSDAAGFIGPRVADGAYTSYELGFVAMLGAVLLATAIVVRRNRLAR